jgi:hypothetical protein
VLFVKAAAMAQENQTAQVKIKYGLFIFSIYQIFIY